MPRKKENIWSKAIENKNEEANKKREASDFLISKEKKLSDQNVIDNNVVDNIDINDSDIIKNNEVKSDKKQEKEILVYTSKKPFKNMNKNINNENNWKLFSVIFSSLLAAIIILIPLILLFGAGVWVVDSISDSKKLMGFIPDETEFAIKHVDSNLYIQNPTYDGEQLILGSGIEQTFMFTDKENGSPSDKKIFNNPQKSNFWIKSDRIFNDKVMTLSSNEDDPIWTDIKHNSVIHLNKKSTNENLFSISINKDKAFLAKDKNSNRLKLSRNPDWFVFEAKVDFINTSSKYLDYYKKTFSSDKTYVKDVELGSEGNSINIQSIKSKKYINSYKYLNHSQIPFLEIEDNEYENSLSLSSKSDSNLFINTNDLDLLSLGSFQTLPLSSMQTNASQKFYPLITANSKGEVKLKQYDLDLGSKNSKSISQTEVWLLPNKNNLRENAIFFPSENSFLETRGGKLELITVDDIENEWENLDYFNLYFSPNINPGKTKVKKTQVTISRYRRNFKLINEDYKSIDGYEFYVWGYDTLNELLNEPENFVENFAKTANCTKKSQMISLKHLNPGEYYHGIVATYRKRNSGVGNEITFTYVPPFQTRPPWDNIDWPNINWPDINWPPLDKIDPGNPDTGNPSKSIIWDSTDEEGPYVDADIPVKDMLTSASNTIEIATQFTQGTENGTSDKIGVMLEEVDSFGNVIEGGYSKISKFTNEPNDGGIYATIFKDLEPEKKYLATMLFYDGNTPFKQIQSSPIELDNGETQMYVTTERVVPKVIEEGTGINWDDAGFAIFGTIGDNTENVLRPSDELNITLKNNSSGLISSTGWMSASNWGSEKLDHWDFAYNELGPKGPFYSAVYDDANIFDKYDIYIWVRMDTSNDFIGWDENSPVFDQDYTNITGESCFDVINIFKQIDASFSSKMR